VLVDEYQDTNRLQAAILLAMKPDGRGLTVVGDDAQSIYAFRGATVRNILDFPGAFRSAGAGGDAGAQLPLDAADPRRREPGDRAAAERFSKELWSDRASAEKPRLVTVRDDAEQARGTSSNRRSPDVRPASR
jgi:DNA helicase-2/ATP-dependent DNA helicase PcrA